MATLPKSKSTLVERQKSALNAGDRLFCLSQKMNSLFEIEEDVSEEPRSAPIKTFHSRKCQKQYMILSLSKPKSSIT